MKQQIRRHLLNTVKKSPSFQESLMRFVSESRQETTIYLGFTQDLRPRYGHGRPPHKRLYELIDQSRDDYRRSLESFVDLKDSLLRIPAKQADTASIDPEWLNIWFPCLDAAALYCFLATKNPKRFFEVGSGNSTKFARRAITDHGLQTRVLSVDPQPRAEIDAICDQIIREPLEKLDLAVFNELEAGDILFIDSSHLVFMNSDVTIAFLELLPELKPGVIVQIHDIFLPYDYPPNWADSYCNEQYLLAAYLLGGGSNVRVTLPNAFISEDEELSEVVAPIWEGIIKENSGIPDIAKKLNTAGGSFWLTTV